MADTYVWKTPPLAVSVTSPGVDSEKGAAVIELMRADVSTEVLVTEEFSAWHSSPLAKVPVCTTATEPSLST